MSHTEQPFSKLGEHLRYVREQSKQSLSEVSGAVEIEETQLERIEAGLERPAEDILLLLISHFDVKDRDAVQLWELANYDSEIPEEIRPEHAAHLLGEKPMIMLLATDVRTMYSDDAQVSVNKAGVVVQFGQTIGQNPGHSSAVARVGMSHQQAEEVIKSLQQALLTAKYQTQHKLLLPPSSHKKADK